MTISTADITPTRPAPKPTADTRPRRRRYTRSALEELDPLQHVAATIYVPVLVGRQLDAQSKVVCPFHGDEILLAPTLHASEWNGWYCSACRRGGGILQLAGLIAGYTLPLNSRERTVVRRALDRFTFAVPQ